MRFFRMLVRIFAEAGLGFIRSGWLNIVIISILMSTLVVFGIMLQLSVSLKKVANNILGSQSTFSVFLTDGADVNSMVSRLKKYKEITHLQIVPKEEAWKEVNSLLQIDLNTSLNSMPDTIIIDVKKTTDAPIIIKRLNTWKSEIEHISYAPEMVKKLNSLKNLLILLGSFISILLAIATFVINLNTIELVIRARKDELTLLRFMGVTNWYIKGPLVLQGILYGLFGATAAGFVLIIFDKMARFNWHKITMEQFGLIELFWPNASELNQILIILVLSSIAFSSASSFWTTERRLKI